MRDKAMSYMSEGMLIQTLEEFIERQERQIKVRRLRKERQRNEIVSAALAEDPIKREERRQVLVDLNQSLTETGEALDRIIKSLEEEG